MLTDVSIAGARLCRGMLLSVLLSCQPVGCSQVQLSRPRKQPAKYGPASHFVVLQYVIFFVLQNDTLVLAGIPAMSFANRDKARRFISLVDELYNARVALVCR